MQRKLFNQVSVVDKSGLHEFVGDSPGVIVDFKVREEALRDGINFKYSYLVEFYNKITKAQFWVPEEELKG